MGIGDPAKVVTVDKAVGELVKRCRSDFTGQAFDLNSSDFSPDACHGRISAYEAATGGLAEAVMALGRWGHDSNLTTLRTILHYLTGGIAASGGNTAWSGLQWYPLTIVYYSAGIGALSADNWPILEELYRVEPTPARMGFGSFSLADQIVSGMQQHGVGEVFKRVPGLEQLRAPASERILPMIRSVSERVFLCDELTFEGLFDQFEVIHTLQYAVGPLGTEPRSWGPVGRFGWKHQRFGGGPLASFKAQLEMGRSPDWTRIGSFVRGKNEILSVVDELGNRLSRTF